MFFFFTRENDIADIAKESGIDLNREDDDTIVNLPKKKKKKKDKANIQKLVVLFILIHPTTLFAT